MAQQTSVDWLIEQLPQIDWDDPFYRGLLQEAKAMEMQQIMESWKHGNLPTFLGRVLTAEQYYNETYTQCNE